MKYSKNSNPSLRPILNKHRKNPFNSITSIKDMKSSEKSYSHSLNISKSTNLLPKIFSFEKQKNTSKITLPPIVLQEKNLDRNVSTPYFNSALIGKKNDEQFEKTNRKGKNRQMFFDHLKHKNINDISFGEFRENFNVFCINK